MKTNLDLREVEILETEWECNEGAWVIDAVFLDDGTPCTEEDLETLTDKYQEEIYQECYEHAACSAYDNWKDRMYD